MAAEAAEAAAVRAADTTEAAAMADDMGVGPDVVGIGPEAAGIGPEAAGSEAETDGGGGGGISLNPSNLLRERRVEGALLTNILFNCSR